MNIKTNDCKHVQIKKVQNIFFQFVYLTLPCLGILRIFWPTRQINFSFFKLSKMAVILKEVKEAVNYWWLLLLTGIILIAMAIWVFTSPVTACVSLSFLFGALRWPTSKAIGAGG